MKGGEGGKKIIGGDSGNMRGWVVFQLAIYKNPAVLPAGKGLHAPNQRRVEGVQQKDSRRSIHGFLEK